MTRRQILLGSYQGLADGQGCSSSCNPKTREEKMKASNITPGHVRAFQAVTSQIYGEVSLWSCRINGEAGVAIVLADHVGEGKVAVMPLFVAITPGMEIEFDDEQGSSGGGGGPKREFRDNAEITRPAFDLR